VAFVRATDNAYGHVNVNVIVNAREEVLPCEST
jgi:hypothetical protein